jgi:hypothetical protein
MIYIVMKSMKDNTIETDVKFRKYLLPFNTQNFIYLVCTIHSVYNYLVLYILVILKCKYLLCDQDSILATDTTVEQTMDFLFLVIYC